MDLQTILMQLLTASGGGIALWAIMALIVKAYPPLDNHSEAKFWLAFVLAFIIPPAAYALQIALGWAVLTPDGVALVIGTSYLISQGVHRGTEAVQAAAGQHIDTL